MRMITSTVAALAVALTAAPVMAQNFNGPYVGVQGGWSDEKVRNPNTDLGVAPIDASRGSAVFGAFVGYDHQVASRVVIGVEGSFNFNTKDTLRSTTSGVMIDPKYSFDVTARAGYLVTPDTLVYVRGGYANERVRTTLTSGTGAASISENRDGWLVGGGVERMIMPHVSARLEYRYTDFSKGHDRYDRHQALAGITYRF
ncbi:MAG: porin family protein [Sphingobium sp.]|nr:porin family protein [Sphingobium sp.]